MNALNAEGPSGLNDRSGPSGRRRRIGLAAVALGTLLWDVKKPFPI
ncbi:hypothetical protein ACWD01_35950 [Streptomyces sp. NPDC002835]